MLIVVIIIIVVIVVIGVVVIIIVIIAENTLRRGYNDALEIYHNNRWGYVCDDLFDQLDATVACRDLGHPGVISYQIRIQVLSEFFWLDNLACTGLELSLADCKSNDFQFENCYSSEGVTVECTPNSKLLITLL